MKYFWTLFWTFALIQMLAYVGSSMAGVAYDFVNATILGVIATVLILIVSAIIPSEPAGKEGLQ